MAEQSLEIASLKDITAHEATRFPAAVYKVMWDALRAALRGIDTLRDPAAFPA